MYVYREVNKRRGMKNKRKSKQTSRGLILEFSVRLLNNQASILQGKINKIRNLSKNWKSQKEITRKINQTRTGNNLNG